jgi:CHAT domain-containing protein
MTGKCGFFKRMRYLGAVLILVLHSTMVWAQQAKAPDLWNDVFVTLDPVHAAIQPRALTPWKLTRGGMPVEYDPIRINAARELERLINEYEVVRGVGKNDWRIGVLLSDLGVAYETKATERQQTAALNAAIATLGPLVGSDQKLDLVYAQAVHRLARRFDKPTADRSQVAQRLAEGIQLLRSKRSTVAEQALIAAWRTSFNRAQELPGFERVLALVAGQNGSSTSCPAALDANAAQATILLKSGKAVEARKLATDTGSAYVAAVRRGCSVPFPAGIAEILAAGGKTPLVADLREAGFQAEARQFTGQWSRASESFIPTNFADILEHGSLEQFRRAMTVVLPHLGTSPVASNPADFALFIAGGLVLEENFDRAEFVYEKVKELRPGQSGMNTGGWGAAGDVVAAAEFHAEYGKRARATELARIALSGFASNLKPKDKVRARLMLARNAFDEGDAIRAAQFVQDAAQDAAAAADVANLQTIFTFARALPAATDEILKPDFIGHAGAMLTRFGKDLSAGTVIRNDHVPSMQFAIDVAVRYREKPLFDRAKVVSPRSFEWIGSGHRRALLRAGDPIASWFPEPVAKPTDNAEVRNRAAFDALDLLFLKKDYVALNDRLRTIPAPDRKFDCSYGDIEVGKLVASERAAGRAPTAAAIDKAVNDRTCAGNSLSSIKDENLNFMGTGLFWLSVGEPVAAVRYLDKSVPSLVGGMTPNAGSDFAARDPEAPGYLTSWAKAKYEAGDRQGALAVIDRATRTVAARLALSGSANDRRLETSRLRAPLDAHVAIAAGTLDRNQSPNDSTQTLSRVLETMQLARATATATATARLATRLSASDAATGAIVRKRQDLSDIVEREGRLVENAKEDAARQTASQRLTDAARQLQDINRELKARAPLLADGEATTPATLAEVRAVLSDNEALLISHTTPTDIYLLLITPNASRLVKIDVARGVIADLITELRSGLDIVGRTLPRFREEAAATLRAKIIAPFDADLAGKTHLTLVLDGALESLPFAVLKRDKTPTDQRQRYLIEQFSLAHLPTVRSLISLRALGQNSVAPEPFLGIGDPVLGPPGQQRGARMSSLTTRSATERLQRVRELPSLPDTADELRTLSRMMQGKPDDIWLGRGAIERRVKSTDLSRYRRLAFATHAVVAGDLDGVSEPSIILTPPDQPTDEDDGILSASEISTLKLSADLVILSACNTAAADGRPGADGLSGLARAFIGAGAKSLVISHWHVESSATAKLMTRFGGELASGKSPAGALKAAMLDRLNNSSEPNAGHPALWGAFFVVGAGR